jgi:hypothetical protein
LRERPEPHLNSRMRLLFENGCILPPEAFESEDAGSETLEIKGLARNLVGKFVKITCILAVLGLNPLSLAGGWQACHPGLTVTGGAGAALLFPDSDFPEEPSPQSGPENDVALSPAMASFSLLGNSLNQTALVWVHIVPRKAFPKRKSKYRRNLQRSSFDDAIMVAGAFPGLGHRKLTNRGSRY